MLVNIWIALTTAAKNAVNTRLNWDDEQGEYSGNVSDTEYKIFRRFQQHNVRQRMFRPATIGGKTWHVYLLDFNLSGSKAGRLQDALDFLEANRAGKFLVVGAWHWDGRQVGTQWEVVDGERVQENIGTEEEPEWRDATTGTPMYPLPSTNNLLKIMPTIKTWDEQGNMTETAPTELTDVNLIQGQAPRRFD